MKKQAQQILEFVILFPFLIVLVLVVLEIAMFWQEFNVVQMTNEEISATLKLEDYSQMEFGEQCKAYTTALELLKKKDKNLLILADATYSESPVVKGIEPFASYEVISNETNKAGKPVIKMKVDCTNAHQGEIGTELKVLHRVMFFNISLPLPNFSGERIEIIPANVELVSTKQTSVGQF